MTARFDLGIGNYPRIKDYVKTRPVVAASHLQRKYDLTYERVCEILDQLIKDKVVYDNNGYGCYYVIGGAADKPKEKTFTQSEVDKLLEENKQEIIHFVREDLPKLMRLYNSPEYIRDKLSGRIKHLTGKNNPKPEQTVNENKDKDGVMKANEFNFVLGFLFSKDKSQVALIRKLKPDWQKGKLNGIGGKIEENETPIQAMVREFQEEAGVEIKQWFEFCQMEFRNGMVYVFMQYGELSKLKSMEEEKVEIVKVCEIPLLKTIPNLDWLIPLAIDNYPIVEIKWNF